MPLNLIILYISYIRYHKGINNQKFTRTFQFKETISN